MTLAPGFETIRAAEPVFQLNGYSSALDVIYIYSASGQVTLPGGALRRIVNSAPKGDVTLAPGFALASLNLVSGLGSGGFIVPSLLTGTLQLQSGGYEYPKNFSIQIDTSLQQSSFIQRHCAGQPQLGVWTTCRRLACAMIGS